MIRIQKPLKIPVVCANRQLADQWCTELKSVGIPVVAGSESVLTKTFSNEPAFLLIRPDFDQVHRYKKFLDHPDKQIFLVTDDQRWNSITVKASFYFIPESTHPLELARLLVEKLNLPVSANKQSYAFSFFSF